MGNAMANAKSYTAGETVKLCKQSAKGVFLTDNLCLFDFHRANECQLLELKF